MKKITLSVALVAAILSAKAQDTTCTYFNGKTVHEFDYYMDTILYSTQQTTKYYEITVKYGDVVCLDFGDEKLKVRKVITTFFDGSIRKDILDSGDNIYYSPRGTIKVSIGKSRNIILGNYPQTLNIK